MKWIGLLLVLATLTGASGPAPKGDLSLRARRILDYLLADWQKPMHSTSIPLAMQNLDLGEDDSLRLEVGQYLREHPGLHNNVTWWGANNYLLSNEEKRIAKWLITTWERQKRVPDLAESARELEIDPGRLRRRLAFMEGAGLLETSEEVPLGYRLTAHYARWGGPLRYNFHTVTINRGRPFDVW